MIDKRERKRFFRHQRIRRKVRGTAQQPRLCVHRSLNNMQAQIVDDDLGKVLCGLSTLSKSQRSQFKKRGNIQAAAALGETFANEARQKGISKVCFDRGGYLFHGRVKAFAEGARKGGLEF